MMKAYLGNNEVIIRSFFNRETTNGNLITFVECQVKRFNSVEIVPAGMVELR